MISPTISMPLPGLEGLELGEDAEVVQERWHQRANFAAVLTMVAVPVAAYYGAKDSQKASAIATASVLAAGFVLVQFSLWQAREAA